MNAAPPLRHFKLLRSRVDLTPFRAELARDPQAWDANTRRQRDVKVQRNTQNIALRSGIVPPDTHINDAQDVVDTPLASSFPETLAFLHAFAAERRASLARVMFVRLAPGARVYRHRDDGQYYLIRDRYHLIVESPAGSPFITVRERNLMREGELWWFDNKLEHEAFNPGKDWRVHLIFDLLPDAPA
jgi:Aspartyl/Asparaginyl beta-hydroxylase